MTYLLKILLWFFSKDRQEPQIHIFKNKILHNLAPSYLQSHFLPLFLSLSMHLFNLFNMHFTTSGPFHMLVLLHKMLFPCSSWLTQQKQRVGGDVKCGGMNQALNLKEQLDAQLPCLLSRRPWAGYLTSLSVSVLVCNWN